MHATDVAAVVAPFTHMFGTAVAAHALRAGATVVASPAPGFALMSAVVVDPDSGERVGPDEPGELWIRGPQVMAGYLRDQQETAQVLDRDGWLRTCDLCSIDAEGNIFILDRLKELIKVGGASVAPAEVERELMAHPAVLDAVVVGRPHAELGEVPVAYVSLREHDDASELLRGFFDGRLAPWKHPETSSSSTVFLAAPTAS
jgi:acyl-CoA synthetase (AMP-forming)/AMP-acid ligase II